MRKHLSWILLLVPLLVMIAANIMAWPHLADRIPIHWNIQGEADSWGGKASIWLLPGLYLGVGGFLQLITLRLPGSGEDPNQKSIHWITAGIAFLFLYLYAHTLLIALHPAQDPVPPLTGWGLAVFTTFLGLSLKHCKRNSLVGIRSKWTLASEEIWDRTHRFTSSIFICAGIFMTFFASIVKPAYWVGFIISMGIISVIYSYQLQRGSKGSSNS